MNPIPLGQAAAAGLPAPAGAPYENSSLVPPLVTRADGTIQDATGRVVTRQPNGTLVDPNTGYQFAPDGTHVASPSTYQQTGYNVANENMLLGGLGTGLAQQEQGVAGLTGLAQQYQDVINGSAPSAARTQLAMGTGDVARQQLSGAAGLSGNNAGIGRLMAMQNIARAQQQAQLQQALVRAKETDAARAGIGQTYQAIGGLGQSRYGTTLSGATDFANIAAGGGKTRIDKETQDEKNKYGLFGTVLSSAGSIGAAAAGAP